MQASPGYEAVPLLKPKEAAARKKRGRVWKNRPPLLRATGIMLMAVSCFTETCGTGSLAY